MDDETEDNAWHLDKRVPIALIVAIMLQMGGFVYWGARVEARTEALETRVQALEGRFEADDADHERLVRVESLLASVDRRLERMEDSRPR
jgi:Tfp pilus assembly protein PilO